MMLAKKKITAMNGSYTLGLPMSYLAIPFFLLFLNARKPCRNAYKEDLSVHRKHFKVLKKTSTIATKPCKKKGHVTPVHDITERLHTLLQQKKSASEQVKTIQGYTIQVYTGKNRALAFKARGKLCTHFPGAASEVQYHLPNYTVSIGKFLDKKEAYARYAAIKKILPQAMIRPTSFANNAYLFTDQQAFSSPNSKKVSPSNASSP